MDALPDPDTRAVGLQRELRERHRTVGPLTADDVDSPAVDTLLVLTARLLDAEEELSAQQERASRIVTDRIVGACVAVLVVAAVSVGAAGLLGGWIDGWGVAGLVLVVVMAAVLAAADLIGERPGSTTRRIDAAAGLVGGAAVLVAATGALPWWGVLIALVLGVAALARILGVLPGPARD